MSLELLGWAWTQDTGDPLSKLMLLVLCERTPSDYGSAEHEFQVLEHECQTRNRSDIRTALNLLADRGLIIVKPGTRSNTVEVSIVGRNRR